MENLPESVLLKIFSYFRISELVRVSRVNSDWRRVAYDKHLWREVNLGKYCKNISDLTLRKLIRNVFSIRLKYLCLAKINISSGTLHLLRQNCPRLKTLILENATFYESYKEFLEIDYFPRNLKELNIAHSIGDGSIYRNIMKSFESDTLERLTVCDAFLELFSENRSTFLNFFLRQRLSLKVLEFSFCKELGDDLLIQILLCCRNLKSLCVRRCSNVKGYSLKSIFDTSPNLRSLALNGAMIRDEVFKTVNWKHCLLVKLDLSWCRHITEDALLQTLPEINQFLRYLYVSCCGYGHALTDKVLEAMTQKSWKFLHELDVSTSYEITDRGLEGFLVKCHDIRKIFKSNCPKLRLDRYPVLNSGKLTA